MGNTTALICGRGTAPAGLQAVVAQADARCVVIDHRDPDGQRSWWIDGPNRGEPFDGQLQRRICAAAKAQGIAGFVDESEATVPVAPAPRRRGGVHRHRPKHTDERVYMGEHPAGAAYAKVQSAQGGVAIRDTCSCGATRLTLANGAHVARGSWTSP
ncbi:MAG: hypothetical protein IT338_17340 [Thermomicrobiales bacterium]|nr:hypothetical protein [Thermomicrobiales bacterium]